MKGIMTACAEDYKTTLLFQTKDHTLLDDIATESNRIDSIYNIDKMIHFDKLKKLYETCSLSENKVLSFSSYIKSFVKKGTVISGLIGFTIGVAILLLNKLNGKKNSSNENNKYKHNSSE